MFMNRLDRTVDVCRTTLELWHLGVETQMVVSMRLMGFAGLWSITPHEKHRMVSEKTSAFAESVMAAGAATLRGDRPDQIVLAATQPLRRKTRSNSRRLVKRGSNWG